MRGSIVAHAAVILAATFGLAARAADVEKPSSLDGSQYTVVAPVYDGSGGGTLSYLRLFNGGTATSTFNVTIVNTSNGITMGAASIPVPKNASPQYPLTSAGGSNSIFTQAGVATSSGATYALYLTDSDALAGYQHVTYNGVTDLFENNSVCTTPISQQLASSNKQTLTNVHTTILSGYPSTIAIHNYAATTTTVTLAAYDAATGTSVGQVNQAIGANSTLSLAESQFEVLLGFHPTGAQPHINVVVTNAAGGTLPVRTTQTVHTSRFGGEVNMGEACAMNAVPTTIIQAAPSQPVAYCGSVTYAAYSYIPITFTASVAPNGKVRATAVGQYGSTILYGTGSTTLNGTSFTYSDSTGVTTGTVQNGVVSGTIYSSQLGSGTFSGSTSGCY